MASTFTKISSIVTDGIATTYTFSSIPQTYKHLVLIGEYSIASLNNTAFLQINGDRGNSYERATAAQANPTSGASTSATVNIMTSGSVPSKNSFKIDFTDYTNTTKNPSFLSMAIISSNLAPNIITVTGSMDAAEAITQIAIAAHSVTVASTGILSLYGVN